MAEITPQDIAAARELNATTPAKKSRAEEPALGPNGSTQLLICLMLTLSAVWATSSAIYWPLDLAAADNTGAYWLGALGWGVIIGAPGGLGLGLAMLGHRIGTLLNTIGLCCAVMMAYAAASRPEHFIADMGDLVARVMGS